MRILLASALALSFLLPIQAHAAAAKDAAHPCLIKNTEEPGKCVVDATVLDHAVVNYGDSKRIKAMIAKGRAGKPISYVAIGGSVTQGAWATLPCAKFASRIDLWLKQTFPKSKVHYVNAGIGQTDSAYGLKRVKGDVLAYRPDLVIVDFDVNDAWQKESTESYRTLVKTILDSPTHPAVILLAVMDRNGNSAQDWHMPVAKEFNLPYLSEKNALLPLVKSGDLKLEDVTADAIHPNDLGHHVLAQFIAYRILSDF